MSYYETLEIKRGASKEEIKRAYRALAMKHHPDHNKGDNDAEERFKEINEAYAELSQEGNDDFSNLATINDFVLQEAMQMSIMIFCQTTRTMRKFTELFLWWT